jgi:hypothetical protein
MQLAVLGYRQDIHVSGRPPDKAQGRESGTTYDHDLDMTADRLQLIGQRAKQQVNRLVGDLHVRSVGDRDDEHLESRPSKSSFEMLDAAVSLAARAQRISLRLAFARQAAGRLAMSIRS